MKRDLLLLNAVVGSLFAVVGLYPWVQAGQQKKPEAPRLIRKTNVALQATAINRVEAVIPPAAAEARIFGTVIVEVSIDETGTVTSARALSGHRLLQGAAVDAARGWTFNPAMLQGKPVKVLGTLAFNFTPPEYVLRDRLIEALKQQIKTNPRNSKLHYRLGRSYEDNEQFADALKEYAIAVDIDPRYGEAHVAIGNLNMKLNQYDAALRAYNQAVLLDLAPEIKAASYRSIALIYFRRDEFHEAVEPFKRAIALAPQGSMYLNLGLTYLKLGDKTSALEQYALLKERNSILAAQLLEQINLAK
jgi:TonB family protein